MPPSRMTTSDSNQNRLAARFADLRQRGETALGLFISAGFPTHDATLPILHALDEGGVDFIEVGVPFSDAVGDGSTIQGANEKALENGMTVEGVFEIVRQFREHSDTPLVLMGYANPVARYGVSNFCARARSLGVDGLILPDVTPDSAEWLGLDEAAASHDLSLIYLITPSTSPERAAAIAAQTSGFVYAVSQPGVTGGGLTDADKTAAYLARVRDMVHDAGLPMCVGFGIKTPDDAARLGAEADGIIVGSELIRLAERLWDEESSESQRLAEIREFAAALKAGATRHDT